MTETGIVFHIFSSQWERLVGFGQYRLSMVPAFDSATGVFTEHRLYCQHCCHWHLVIGNQELQRPTDIYCFNIKGCTKSWHCE